MTKNKLRLREGDTVKVIAGKDKGRIGKIVSVNPETRRVVVEGVALCKRHTKGTGDQPGAVVSKEASIDVSNVALWNSAEGRTVKVGFSVVDDRKVRVDRKSRTPIGSR